MGGLYVGLISGTSMDGVDAALVELGSEIRLLQALSLPYPPELRQRLLEIADPGARPALRELGSLDVRVGVHFATAVEMLLRDAGIPAERIVAIGSHGQTIGHYPDDTDPSTLQIGDPNIIAERTATVTVADFRRRDLAVGGQGAPLVPGFHRAVLQSRDETRIVANIGGIANITVLHADGHQSAAFDTGPGNTLLDAWSATHLHQPLDAGGEWGAGGTVEESFLGRLLDDAYFTRPPPKSTGREYFNRHWLHAVLERHGADIDPQDVQATLSELTARTLAGAARSQAPAAARLIVCGGGAHNTDLMRRLAAALAPIPVQSSIDFGIDPDWMEAMAFAWLAARRLSGKAGNLPSATGARKRVLLGAVFPGDIRS